MRVKAAHKNVDEIDPCRSDHPQVEVLTPEQLSDIYLNQETRYDAMITFSSIEHSGLGRYLPYKLGYSKQFGTD